MMTIAQDDIVHLRWRMLTPEKRRERPRRSREFVKVSMATANTITAHVQVDEFRPVVLRDMDIVSVSQAPLEPPRDQPLIVVAVDALLLIWDGSAVIAIGGIDVGLFDDVGQHRYRLRNNL